MVIDGKKLALKLHEEIIEDVLKLKKKGIHPKLAIVTVGSEAAWQTYVGQKLKFAQKFGIQTEQINLKGKTDAKLFETVKKLNQDPTIHGIIVQRPIPSTIDAKKLNNLTSPEKDIDGFRSDSLHEGPVWLASKYVLMHVFSENKPVSKNTTAFKTWLKKKQIVVVGKGESGGKPVISGLYKMNIVPKIIDSKTKNPENILKEADIIITAAGREVIKAENLKKGVIIIGIGIYRGEDGKLYGDYNEEEIKTIASYYTPTPGGVGPINLSYLFKNLVNAVKLQVNIKLG